VKNKIGTLKPNFVGKITDENFKWAELHSNLFDGRVIFFLFFSIFHIFALIYFLYFNLIFI
jgi:hypothetical protein